MGYIFYGHYVWIQVRIDNPTDYDVSTPFKVICDLYDDGETVPSHQYEQTVIPLAAHTTSGYINFTDWVPVEGIDSADKRILIKVDPENEISEINEGNNELSLDIMINDMPGTL